MSNNTKKLVRIIASSTIVVACLIATSTTQLNVWWQLALFAIAYLTCGFDVVTKAVVNIFHGKALDENFLMTVATIGAFAIEEYADACFVMILYQIGELFQHYAVGKSRQSITQLLDIRPEQATVLRNGKQTDVHPADVLLGENIIIKSGEKIPLDGIVVSGTCNLDTSAITGESMPKQVSSGQCVTSGCINLDGVITICTTSTYDDSTVAKIIDLVENATSQKAPAENFITKFSKYYTPIVVALAVILGVVFPLFVGSWQIWLKRAMMFLFVSCPCALVISVPLGFFGGIASSSKQGIWVKGSNYVELLSKVDTVVFDKTGTLTKGNFAVVDVYPQENKTQVLQTACIAEQYSNHPIAQSICKQATASQEATVQEIAGLGLKATTASKDEILCGNDKLMQRYDVPFTPSNQVGTTVYVAKNGNFVGYVVIADEIKSDAKQAVEDLHKLGCSTVMLTGDNLNVANEVAQQLCIDTFSANLLPQDKVSQVKKLIERDKKVAFVGDGINDAPVLATANLGIAMGNMGSDVAVETADVVLMRDNPTAIVKAKRIAKKTMRIVKQNIVFSIAVKVAVLAFSAVGLLDKLPFGMVVAILADVGVCVVAILNSMRAMLAPKATKR